MGLAVVVVLARDGRVYVASRVASPDHDRFWSARRRGAPPRLGADDGTRPSERAHGRTQPKYLDLHLKKKTQLTFSSLPHPSPPSVMSANCATDVVLRGIIHGAVDYLLKPVRIEELRNIWQHVVRRKRESSQGNLRSGEGGSNGRTVSGGSSGEGGGKDSKGSSEQIGDAKDKTGSAGGSGGSSKRKKGKKGDEGTDEVKDGSGGDENEDSSALKKPRVVWSAELHQQFVTAVNQLGIDKAVPKRILDLMGVQGLTRENVASHLQKYRLYLKRLQGVNSGGAPGGGPGFMSPIAVDGTMVQGGPGGRVGSPAIGGPNGPIMVGHGHIDPAMLAGGAPQTIQMGMVYGGPGMGPPQMMAPNGKGGGGMPGGYVMQPGQMMAPNGQMMPVGQMGPGGMMVQGPGGGMMQMHPDGGMMNGNGSYGSLQNMKQGNGVVMMPNNGIGGVDGAIPNMTTGLGNGQGLPDDDVLDMFLKDGLPEGEGF